MEYFSQDQRQKGKQREIKPSEMHDQIAKFSKAVGMRQHPTIVNALDLIFNFPKDERLVKECYRDAMELLGPEIEIFERYKSPFEPLPPQQFAEGPIKLGLVNDDRVGMSIGGHPSWPEVTLGLSFKEINEHTLILGRSGAGKTSLITNMVLQLIQNNVKCWIIDMQKDYRGLMNVLPDDVLVIPWRMFKFNPLRPPAGVAPNDWVSDFSDILCEALVAYRGAKNIIQRNIAELFEEYEVETTNVYPTIHNLYDKLKKSYSKTRKEAGYRELQHLDTASSIIEMTARGLESVVDCDEGYPIDVLLDRNVVFELWGMGGELKTVFVNLLFGWIIAHRVATGQKEGWWTPDEQTHNLRNVLVFDEAKTVFDIEKEKKRGSTIPYVMEAVTTLRKYGLGLIVSDQMWNMLATSITSNVNTKIALSSNPEGLMEIVRYLGLEGEEQIKMLQSQPAMNAIIKLADRWPYPCPISFERFHYDPEVTDFEIKIKSGKILDDLGWKPARELVFEKGIPKPEHQKLLEEPKAEEPKPTVLSREARLILEDICENHFSSITERYARLELSADKGNSTVELLERNELIKKDYVDFGKGGGRVALLSLTDEGCEVIGNKPKIPGKGSIQHRYLQHRAHEVFRGRGFICEIESKCSDTGETIDLLASKSNELVGVEIELGTKNEQPIQNIKKCLERGCTQVKVYCKTTLNKKLSKKLKQEDFSLEELGKIELVSFSSLAPSADRKQQELEITVSTPLEVIEKEEEPVTEEKVEPETPPFVMPEKGELKVYLGHVPGEGKDGWVFWEPLREKPKKIPNPHIMILGTSGAGKTQTLMSLVYELHRQNVPSVIFDFHGEYAGEEFGRKFNANVMEPLGEVNINPLELPTDPKTGGKANPVQLVHEVTDIIDGIYRLGIQQKALLRKALFYTLGEAGIYKDQPDTWGKSPPDFEELNKALVHFESSGDSFAPKLRAKIEELFETELFSTKETLPIETLLQGLTVLNLHSIHWDAKLQLTMSRFFLKKIYNEMMREGESKGIKIFCIIDEAHKVTSDPIIEKLVREARKYGLGLILASHMPKDFDESVFSNTATKIVLKLEKDDHAKEIVKHLGNFSRKEKERLRSEILSLDTFHAFIVNNHYLPYTKIRVKPYFERIKDK